MTVADRQYTNGEPTGGERKYDKSSAVAEMGDRGHNRHGPFRDYHTNHVQYQVTA